MFLIKNRLLYVTLMIWLVIALAACGGQAGSGASNAPAEQTGDSSPVTDKSTKIFKAANGDVEIPVHPQRIVAITFLGDLLALGVKPVGAGSIALNNSVLLEKELEGVADVGDVSVEKVLELNPDLIIVPTYLPSETVEQLKKIAPTVAIPSVGLEGGDPLEELKTFGVMLGKEKEAEAFIARYKQKAEEAKAKLNGIIGPDETVGSYSIWAKNLWVWPKTRDAGYNLFEMLQYKPQDKIAKEIFPDGKGKDISLEVLPEFAADHMFITVYEPDGGAERAKEVANGAIWQGLPAVKNNHVYYLDYKKFWMIDGLNLEKQLDILVDLIVKQNQK
ncbi:MULTISPECIES: ABC transporter substrate-binding protein [Paenibacillus]|uniref:Iron(3+)-hydroxamate-binding protein n=1 Tax=Paenibacillus naphthalenovorans TaxID=162209 RepID=A0A0U2VPJ3_9BACL|nr:MULTISPECIES: ABC transporter substrate-binding protein [Paenibacillus]ALS25155.1 iron(3+)-hydroxamate-binding protein [Paenibacillus naphthalenovorans]GCL73263.1 ABC transporter substrate-binding protein [Paenibacillus naphthalenovorans]SDI34211.1 iron complex transport system substrate-binding protein [Paenibacillus naphthalenovorans]